MATPLPIPIEEWYIKSAGHLHVNYSYSSLGDGEVGELKKKKKERGMATSILIILPLGDWGMAAMERWPPPFAV